MSTIITPPGLMKRWFCLSAAAFIATSTSQLSPGGVYFGTDAHLEAADAAEALRGAYFGGVVGEGRHLVAEAGRPFVKILPASCIPSPESPQKRTTTLSRVLTCVFCNIIFGYTPGAMPP